MFKGKTARGIILSLIIVVMLASASIGVGFRETIDVLFNSINLTVNDEKVSADTILYRGTTYIPVRAVGEMLEKEVGWDGETRTASINDKVSEEEIRKVFITETGNKYHREDCRYLDKSKVSIDLNEIQEQYEPCGVCKP